MLRAWIALAGLLAVASAGCTAPQPGEPVLVEEERTLEPDGFLEVNLEMNATDAVTAAFEAQEPVAWDVHSHREGEVVLHDEGRAATGTVAFEAPSGGTYSLLWENDGDEPVELSATVRGQATVISLVP